MDEGLLRDLVSRLVQAHEIGSRFDSFERRLTEAEMRFRVSALRPEMERKFAKLEERLAKTAGSEELAAGLKAWREELDLKLSEVDTHGLEAHIKDLMDAVQDSEASASDLVEAAVKELRERLDGLESGAAGERGKLDERLAILQAEVRGGLRDAAERLKALEDAAARAAADAPAPPETGALGDELAALREAVEGAVRGEDFSRLAERLRGEAERDHARVLDLETKIAKNVFSSSDVADVARRVAALEEEVGARREVLERRVAALEDRFARFSDERRQVLERLERIEARLDQESDRSRGAEERVSGYLRDLRDSIARERDGRPN